MQIDGKVAVITGAAEGIGAACARAFARKGAYLSVIDLNCNDRETDRELFTSGDVTRSEDRERLMERTIAKFGHADILVNNAGVGIYAPASKTCLNEARAMFEVNLFAPLAMAQLAAPYLRRRQGAIVNIDSIGGLVTLPWSTMYCSSKHAFYSLSQGLRRELQNDGINVITVIPGIVNTRFRENVLSGVVPEKVGRIRRVISPDRLAEKIVRSVERERTHLYDPAIARLFAFVDRFLPKVMDVYLYSVGR
jgi:short-subunit dehydrogenase